MPETRCVLIVEDDSSVRHLIAKICRPANYEVLEAASIEDAAIMIRNLPDLITMDERLSDGSGMQLVSLIRADPTTSGIPIVAVTGSCSRQQAIQAGCSDYIEKPFAPQQLLDILKKFLAGE